MDTRDEWNRRDFLGAAAGAGAGAFLAGCSADGGDGDTAPGAPSSAPARPSGSTAAAENDLPGTRDWGLRHQGADRDIEGYADQVSVAPGQPFTLHVSTSARRFGVDAFRMGWYGGAQARKVWASGPVAGRVQPVPEAAGATRTVAADWTPATEVPTHGWPEGSYLLRLTAESGSQRYVPVTVRSRSTAGRLVLVNAVGTWQAYNTWGGHSLYHGPGGSGDDANRSLAASCDRPYDENGANLFLTFERPAIALAEKLGLAPAYVTSMDIDRDPALLAGARAVISLGHDEYWTPAMRARVTRARDTGSNIAFLGANACFRRIRLEPTRLGERRLVVCYKTDWTRDPAYGTDDAAVTNNWREPPHADPENSLTGTLYESNPTTADYVVAEPGHWLFEGTGALAGTRFPGLVGTEYDRVNSGEITPRPIEIIAHSRLECRGVRSFADSAYYTVPSGAGVFNAGTMRWVGSLEGAGGHGITDRTAVFTSQVTANLLRAFAEGPAGHRHPAKDNLDAYHPYQGDPIWTGNNLW
ncbi:twin-arginine translocation signal domain-containing protein [Streptomyces sp. H10-C2]|uniref:N,N-dimethylformamidase beta subunit family domain-containing protein n=1 Tax=unclassified Streptomyces TaxID=2593676 RepID=UPI0024BAC3CB|nr:MULTISPECIES: N,N-dimethylformamidase beta subunit family domain-containing protein [unclassified Streptomyces]MDJ0346913.1 twin-arginine translocation signal domain-containing protein [Streptomyces sp. PH10-H1]MDJ0375244.1 twin-arginine translocation signal domain-containing protein [Streptomyces sp. H10-C2]